MFENLMLFISIGAMTGWVINMFTKPQYQNVMIFMAIGGVGGTIGGEWFSTPEASAFGIGDSLAMATLGALACLFIYKLVIGTIYGEPHTRT